MSSQPTIQDPALPGETAEQLPAVILVPEPVQTPPLRRRILRHAFVLSVFAIALAVFAWMLTYGQWRLFDAEDYGQYYDALAANLLHGRLDVPLDAIRGEAFIRDGKYYGYFGFGPSLLRIPLRYLLPAMNGRWSRSFMLLACGLNMLFAYRLVLLLRRRPAADSDAAMVRGSELSPEGRGYQLLVSFFLLAVGLGSTPLFLASRSYVYHEASMWAATAAILCGYYVLRFLLRPSAGTLIAAGSAAFFSFFSRPTTGAGCLLALAAVSAFMLAQYGVRRWKPAWNEANASRPWPTRLIAIFARESASPLCHALLAGGFTVGIVVVYFAMNYTKFRTLDGVPVKLYVQYIEDPKRMAVTGGKQIHLVNFRTCAAAYLRLGAIEFRPTFPWAFMTLKQHVYPGARIDAIEPASSLPASMPALLLLSCVGTIYMLVRPSSRAGKLKLPAAALLAGGGIVFVTVGITQRYLNDLVPFLVCAGAAGVCVLAAIRSRWATAIAVILLAPLTLASVLVNLAFALEYQRVICWGVPAASSARYREFRGAVDSLFAQGEPLETISTDDDRPPTAQRGQVWIENATGATHWYNGQEWVTIRPAKGAANPPGQLHLRMKLTQWRPGDDEPLVTSGKFEAGDVVYLRHVAPGQVSFGFDHWGAGGKVSRPVSVELDRWYDLQIDLDRLNEQVIIRLGGRTVLKEHTALFPAPPEQIVVGRNDIGGWPPGPESFSGTLLPVPDE